MAKHPQGDRNFDGLVNRFQRNIYNTLKGKTRLAVLQRDFQEFINQEHLTVLDVGAGEGRWAGNMAAEGHPVTLVDVSQQMMSTSQAWFAQQSWYEQYSHQIQWHLASLYDLPEVLNTQYDIVCCHAVLEWLQEPESGVQKIKEWVKPGGYLSLLFYNLDGLIYKNLLRGNFSKVRAKDYRGHRGSLTPLSPLSIGDVTQQLQNLDFKIMCTSGVRVFYDYILDPKQRFALDQQQVIEMELAFSRQDPFRGLGRYIHILARKSVD